MADVDVDVFEWIANQGFGFNRIPEEDRKHASDFAILWTYFEAQVCNKDATLPKLKALAQELCNAQVIDPAPIQEAMTYFRRRYIADGQPTYHFENLHFIEKYRRPMLHILSQDVRDMATELEAALFIIYRYRNNLFHGEKWAYGILDQKENFACAMRLLKRVIAAARKHYGHFG